MADIAGLIERVRAATAAGSGSWTRVSARPSATIGPLGEDQMWTRNWTGPIEARGSRVVLLGNDAQERAWTQAPALTASLDAAVTLVLERVRPGVRWGVDNVGMLDGRRVGACGAHLDINPTTAKLFDVSGFAATPALALIASPARNPQPNRDGGTRG